MLKLLFAGGGFAGFVLAVFLGFGYNPVSAGGHSSPATASQTAEAGTKAELGSEKPVVAAPIAAPAIAAPAPVVAAARAVDPAQIAASLQSLASGATDTASAAAPAASSDDLTSLLNQFSGLIGGNSTTTNGKHGVKNAAATSDFNVNDLMNLIGNAR